MGNRCTAPRKKVDFVVGLPPELVSLVLSHLPLCDVHRCLLVCKDWHKRVQHCQPYWSGLLRGILGLSPRAISLGLERSPGHRDLYLTLSRQQDKVRALELRWCVAACYPRLGLGECWFLPGCGIVRREGGGLRVEEVGVAGDSVVFIRELCRVPATVCPQLALPVRWAWCSSVAECVYWMDGTGHCWAYHVSRKRLSGILMTIAAQEGVKKEKECVKTNYSRQELEDDKGMGPGWPVEKQVMSEMLTVSTGEKSIGDSANCATNCTTFLGETTLAACDECSMVLACCCDRAGERCEWVLASVGDNAAVHTTISSHQNLVHTVHCRESRGREKTVKMELFNASKTRQAVRRGGETCPLHYALLQNTHFTGIIYVRGEKEDEGVPPPLTRPDFSCECLNCVYGVSHLSSALASSCGSLVGQLEGDGHLRVWEVEVREGRLVLLSSAEVSVEEEEEEEEGGAAGRQRSRLELVALGRSLSLVVRTVAGDTSPPLSPSSVSDDSIYVVHTESGNVLKELTLCVPGRLKCKSPPTGPWHYLLSKEARQWLGDMSSPCPEVLLIVICSDGRFLVVRQQRPLRCQTHWVQAINYVFMKQNCCVLPVAGCVQSACA